MLAQDIPGSDHLPAFDTALENVLGWLHVSPVIIFMVYLAFTIKSWVDGLKDSARWARKARDTAVTTYASLRAVQSVVGVIAAIVGLVAQSVTLWMIYVAGNLVSLMIRLAIDTGSGSLDDTMLEPSFDRLRDFGDDWNRVGAWSLFEFSGHAVLDWGSAIVLLIGIFSLWRSYVSARDTGGVSFGWGFLAAFPISLYFYLWGAGILIGLGVQWITGGAVSHEEEIAALTKGVIAMGLYYGCCIAATKASVLVVSGLRLDRRRRQYATYRTS